jgi:hypothetical protein
MSVSGMRPLIIGQGLRLWLTGGGPSAGTTLGSWVMVGVVGRVIEAYWPSVEIRRRSRALSDDNGETGRVLPLEVG